MPISKNWTMEKVLSLDRDQIIALWKALPPATVAELHGHYVDLVPNAGNAKRQANTTAFTYDENSSRGYWLGKACKQTGPHKGEGYNRWRFPDGKVVRNLRFSTEDGISLNRRKPAFLMNYDGTTGRPRQEMAERYLVREEPRTYAEDCPNAPIA